MDSFVQLESNLAYLVGSFVLLGLAGVALSLYLCMARFRRPEKSSNRKSLDKSSTTPRWVSDEIERLCSGEDFDELLFKQMSAESRALFEVSLIDALTNKAPEKKDRLRSALIKCGYDEQCARRVMSESLTELVRASALLSLLRPQWRDQLIEAEQPSTDEGTAQVRAAQGQVNRE
ncbi:MAG: hypothetical protein WAV47_08210 [Blastocatellia bacterium]